MTAILFVFCATCLAAVAVAFAVLVVLMSRAEGGWDGEESGG